MHTHSIISFVQYIISTTRPCKYGAHALLLPVQDTTEYLLPYASKDVAYILHHIITILYLLTVLHLKRFAIATLFGLFAGVCVGGGRWRGAGSGGLIVWVALQAPMHCGQAFSGCPLPPHPSLLLTLTFP
jgi:hypothetical protein